MTKHITVKLTQDQLNYVCRAIENDWEDETNPLGEQDWQTVEAKRSNAFRRRLLNKLAQAKN